MKREWFGFSEFLNWAEPKIRQEFKVAGLTKPLDIERVAPLRDGVDVTLLVSYYPKGKPAKGYYPRYFYEFTFKDDTSKKNYRSHNLDRAWAVIQEMVDWFVADVKKRFYRNYEEGFMDDFDFRAYRSSFNEGSIARPGTPTRAVDTLCRQYGYRLHGLRQKGEEPIELEIKPIDVAYAPEIKHHGDSQFVITTRAFRFGLESAVKAARAMEKAVELVGQLSTTDFSELSPEDMNREDFEESRKRRKRKQAKGDLIRAIPPTELIV